MYAPSSSSSCAKRFHCGVNSVPPEKMPVMPALRMRRAHRLEPQRQRLEQLRRREHALDVVAGAEDRDRLIDDVILVGLQVLGPALLDQLDDPARIEVDAEADAAAMLRQVLDRQPQPARAGRAEHQPVRALRKLVVGQRVAESSSSRCGSLRWLMRDLRHAGACRRSRRRRSACRRRPSAPSAAPGRRAATRLRRAELVRGRRSPLTSFSGSKSNCLARSSQNGQPVAGSKCQRTISRTWASSRSRATLEWPRTESWRSGTAA